MTDGERGRVRRTGMTNELDLTEGAIVVMLRTNMCPTVLLNFGERGAGP
jgi:hypothetical protein